MHEDAARKPVGQAALQACEGARVALGAKLRGALPILSPARSRSTCVQVLGKRVSAPLTPGRARIRCSSVQQDFQTEIFGDITRKYRMPYSLTVATPSLWRPPSAPHFPLKAGSFIRPHRGTAELP